MILDASGKPFAPRDLLSQQTHRIAALQYDHLNTHPKVTTPKALGKIFRDAEQGQLVAQSDFFDEMLEHDTHLFSEYSKRTSAPLTRTWKITPHPNPSAREKRLVEQLTEWLTNLTDFDEMVLDLMDAVGHGFAPVEITWGREGKYWLPKAFTRQPGRWFVFDPEAPRELRLNDGGRGQPLQPFGWIVHRHRAKSGYPATTGLFRVLAWPWLFKHFAFADFSEFLDGYGLPLRMGKYPAHASQKDQDALFNAVQMLGRHGAGVFPDDMQIEIAKIAQSSTGDNMFVQMMDYCDKAMSKALLGGTLTSQADGQTSTNALGNVHNEVRLDLLKSDAKQVANTLTRQLLYPLATLNIGIQAGDRLPYFEFDTRDSGDLALYADAVPKLVQIGMPVPIAWVQEKLQIPVPAPDEPVLTMPSAPNTTTALAALRQIPSVDNVPASPVPTWGSQLAQRTAPQISQWLDQIEQALLHANSLAEFQSHLISLYGDLDSEKLSQLMALGLATAELTGRFEVVQETAHD